MILARLTSLLRWFDCHAGDNAASDAEPKVDLVRLLPFAFMHIGCLAVLWFGWSAVAVAIAVAAYFARMFAITAFYHRYFAHRSFRTSRAGQFLFALAGATAVQRGAMWWAAHHRHHHAHADRPTDLHSPRQQGLWSSHVGWLTARANFRTRLELVPDLARFPELRFLDRYDTLVPIVYAAATYLLGAVLERLAPALGTDGPQMLVWAFFISTTVLYHATFTINSLAHRIGKRRYATDDDSRNSLALALLTMGEGWHNNHHHCQSSARQGFFWWEVDLTYYLLVVLSWTGLVWDLKKVSERALRTGLVSDRAV